MAAGLILPSEISTRLAVHDAALARTVHDAWTNLAATSDPDGLRRAIRWIDGLAAGPIIPSEITTRPAVQDPRLAATVAAAWSALNPVADRGAGWGSID